MPLGKILDIGSKIKGIGNLLTPENSKEFNKQRFESIQARVLDANRAGIHPLFALGANVENTATMGGDNLPFVSETGNRRPARLTPSQVQQNRANIAATNARAQADIAQASYYNSLAQKTRSDMSNDVAQTWAKQLSSLTWPRGRKGTRDQVEQLPDPVVSSRSEDPSTTAAEDKPMFSQYRGPFGLPLWGMQSNEGASEAFEIDKWPMIASKNFEEYNRFMFNNYRKVFDWIRQQRSAGGPFRR